MSGTVAPSSSAGDDPGDEAGDPPVILEPLPEGVSVRSHPEIRTLLLTSEELTAWLLDERTGGVRQLNQAAAAVWALIEEPVTLATLSADLADTFELESSLADEVVGAAVDALRAEDLLELTDADGAVIHSHGEADAASGEADGLGGEVDAASGEADAEAGAADVTTAVPTTAESTTARATTSEVTASDEARLPQLLTRAPDP